MASTPFKLHHSEIGTIVGTGDGEDVVAFKGIPYATLHDRLSDAVMTERYTSPVDATSFGPTSHSILGGFQLELSLIQQSLPEPDLTSSDLHALNLNIYVPKIGGKLPERGSLPVFVWIHGGGFISGSSGWPQYDLSRFVKFELRSAGYNSNNQLRDQRTAFAWLRRFVGGFGGDPDQVTVAGESAGAVATGLHLQSSEPLFTRALMTGGSSLLNPPADAAYQERLYEQAIQALGLGPGTPQERIHGLLTMPMDQLMTKLSPPLPYRPTADGDLIPSLLPEKDGSVDSWWEIVNLTCVLPYFVPVGSRDHAHHRQASSLAIFVAHVKPGISKRFPEAMRHALISHGPAVSDLLDAYGFGSERRDDDTAFRSFLDYANDLCYYAATVAFARGWPTDRYVFFLNERNPWPGLFQGEATHVFDVSLLFQNFNERLPPAMRNAARRFATDVFTFVHGNSPWPSHTVDRQRAKVYGPSSWDTTVDEPVSRLVDGLVSPETGRRRVMIDIGDQVGFDCLASAFTSFLAE
ncbi:hypothetical protein ACJ41O_006090 [Fusarium nematophilum]